MPKPAWLDELALLLLPAIPPALGVVIGLRYTRDQTPWDRLTSALGGFGLGIYFGAAIAEYAGLGPRSTVAVGILVSMFGMELIGVGFAFVRQFKSDPLGAFRSWWQAWWNRGSSS